MGYFLTSLLSFFLIYKYTALFSIVLSGALLIPWPTNTLLLAAGAFAGQGYFSFVFLFLTALCSNVLGDCIGYFLTNKWGFKIIKEHHIKKFASVEKLTEYLKEHAEITILLTRFVGTVGPLVNFLSGLIRIPFKKFLLYDILGNALDIGLFLAVGYAVGSVWQDFSGMMRTIGWMLLVLLIINILIRILWKRRMQKDKNATENH